jgi:tRNA (adenine57-N1/adenine58-N1)-methyltransferase
MDFSRPHVHEPSVATQSKIHHLNIPVESDGSSLDDMLFKAANQAAKDLLLGNVVEVDDPHKTVDASLYPERITPHSPTIQANELVVIFESFDNLNFCYSQPGRIFSNRNGHFHHDDFIGKPFGCKIRSKNNRGYGFVYLLKPTPELWVRSLNHRTQIVHELDASMICFYLNLRPNMVVCESGTGSGAMSHCILRTIAPAGSLHTYEFNQSRAETAASEFKKNGVGHLVSCYHKDVCGKNNDGGFGLPQGTADAIFLDLPEPWLAIPHAAYTLKPNARVATYSPCVEQSQKTVLAMRQAGFHSMKTMEFRLKEHYVDEVEYEPTPKEKRPRIGPNPHLFGNGTTTTSGGEDTGAEADNEKSEYETEGEQQASLATAGTTLKETTTSIPEPLSTSAAAVATAPPGSTAPLAGSANGGSGASSAKRKKMLVARPFVNMRGHTAFLTFATSGIKPQPDPNTTSSMATAVVVGDNQDAKMKTES